MLASKEIKVGDKYYSELNGWGTVVMVSPHRLWTIVNWDNDPSCFEQVPIEDNEVADEYMHGR